ncbi:MAG TPA: hypothetical protein VEI97_13040 [bacterium]|nr:hypothetical protein [bacterium]
MLLALAIAGSLIAVALRLRRAHPLRRAGWLLAPCCPVLGWGPLTHCYVNHKARKQFLATNPPTGHPVARLLRDPQGGRRFVQHGVDPDVIKAYHFLEKEVHFEYAHNPLPNRYFGRPRFGHALWAEARTDDERFSALGWYSHQVADQFAHNVPFERFYGYVNREACFGYFWDEVMHHLQVPYREDLGGAFYSADHWTTELIIDSYVYATLGLQFDRHYILGRRPIPFGLWERTSRRYLERFGAEVAEDYSEPMRPLDGRPLRRCREFCDLINAGTFHYVAALVRDQGADRFRARVLADPKFAHLQTVLDLVAAQVAKVLAEPGQLYEPVRVRDASIRLPDQPPAQVEAGPLAGDEEGYWNQAIYAAYRAHRPRKRGSIYRALKVLPLPAMRWVFQRVPITAHRGPLAKRLIPQGTNNLGLSLGVALRMRRGDWATIPAAVEDVLVEKGLLGPSESRERVRTF